MSEVTEADRKTAVDVLSAIHADAIWRTSSTLPAVERIAAALADERERARAPFLRLLYRLDEPNEALPGRDQAALAWLAEHVRAAAQEPPT